MNQIQLTSITQEELQEKIIEGVKALIDKPHNELILKILPMYLTIKQVCVLLTTNRQTLKNWRDKEILIPRGIGGKVLYKLSDIEEALTKI